MLLINKLGNKDVEEDRCQREARCKPVDNEAQPQHRGDAGPGECRRSPSRSSPVTRGRCWCDYHHTVDIAVDVAVERVGRAGTQAAADECREHEPEVGMPPAAGSHHRCGRHGSSMTRGLVSAM